MQLYHHIKVLKYFEIIILYIDPDIILVSQKI